MKDIRAGSAALWMLFIFGLSAPTYGQAGGSPGNQETAGANLTLKSTAHRNRFDRELGIDH